MEYIEIKEGKVVGHYSSQKMPEGKEFEVVEDFQGFVGCEAGMLNSDGTLKPEKELIELGFIEDNRGEYWNVENKSRIVLTEIGEPIPENYTAVEPKPFDEWDGSKWIENIEKKAEYEKQVKITEAQYYLNSTDYKVIKAMEAGVSLDELYPGEVAMREEKRQIIRDLTE